MIDPINPLRFTPTYAGTTGAQMLATTVTTGLYGAVLIYQYMVIIYFSRHSQRDPWWTKALVASLGVLVSLETIFANHQIYWTLVTIHDNQPAQNIIPFSMPAKTACIFLSAFLAQMFYASRIWKLGGAFGSLFRFAVVPIVLLALLQLGGGMIQVIIMGISKTHRVMFTRVALNIRSMYIHGISTAICDGLITIALVAILRSTNVNATRRSNTLLERLVVYTINRGHLRASQHLFVRLRIWNLLLVGDLCLALYASLTSYSLIPFSSNTHVYIISVISMLTTREDLREDMQKSFHISDILMNSVSHNTEDDGETGSTADAVLNREQSKPQESRRGDDPSRSC
ncbi:hypothetical protein BKA70DRAFT_1238899 [Coprinopsis sp. MPI-PUGE-AT-0042]|nr:hypothetical protein BKA70DRAFT_1238899 [Coprinopsis sp. MPI-PUGE-AT-0042]